MSTPSEPPIGPTATEGAAPRPAEPAPSSSAERGRLKQDAPPKRPEIRSYRDLLIARADGFEVTEKELRTARRQEELVRSAIDKPRAFEHSGITSAMFELADYKIAWDAIRRATAVLQGDGALSPETVLSEMRRSGEVRFGIPRGNLWMQSITAHKPVDVGYALEVLVPEIVDKHQLAIWSKRMEALGKRVQEDQDPIGLHAEYVTEALKISTAHDGGALAPSMEEMPWDSRDRSAPNVVPTGLKPIDKLCGGGLDRGGLFVVGGGTSHGKSYLCQRMLRNQALMNRPSLYVSVEDPPELMWCRMIADYSSPKLSPKSVKERSADPVVVDDAIDKMGKEQQKLVRRLWAPKWTSEKICQAMRRHRYMLGIDLVIVDYIQAVSPPEGDRTNRTQQVGAAVSDLKRCAGEIGVALVLTTQYAREQYRDGEEPSINAPKYSGDLENEADIMVLLWRDDDERLHAKIPKVKWSSRTGGGLRYFVDTDPVTGCFHDWTEDFSEKQKKPEPRQGGRQQPRGGAA